jgi:alpha-tubulin suppressor-like RCC1 family protein
LPEKTAKDIFFPVPRHESQNCRLKMMSGGGYFSQVLTEDGRLFGCGQGSSGQLGNGTQEEKASLTPADHSMLDSGINYVNCSGGSTAIITRRGSFYTTGNSGYYSSKTFEHTPIPGRVKSVTCGYGFYFVTTGEYFQFCNN